MRQPLAIVAHKNGEPKLKPEGDDHEPAEATTAEGRRNHSY
jgi:hypothetical protein